MKIELDIADECIDQIFVKEAMAALRGERCYGDDEIRQKSREWAELTLWLYGTVDGDLAHSRR